MKRIVLFLAMAAAVLAGAAITFAAPFNPKDVAADPAMLLHVDCDALRASAIGQWLLSDPTMQDKLASVDASFDVDLRKQLHGVTFYTTAAHSKDGVMVVAADFEPGHLLAKAKDLNDFLSATNNSHVIYSWVDEKWKRRLGRSARVYGAISGHHVVYGQTESRLADAMDVLEGTGRGFDGRKEFLQAKNGEGILFEAALLKTDFGNAQGPAAIFQMCKAVYLKVSEANNNTTAVLRLETADDAAATQVNSIVQGFLGMLKMQESNADETKFVNSIATAKDGLAVGVTLSMPSSQMIDMMKSGQEKGRQRGSNRRARDQDSQRDNQ